MEHKSKNGKTYEIGEVNEYRGYETYDIVLIMDWDENHEEPMKIVGYYFGEYDHETTEYYIEQFEEIKGGN